MEPAAPPKWYHNVWFVLVMLLFVVGPFGLPLVWKNPAFPRWVKWALTVVMVCYTLWLLDLTIRMTRAILAESNAFQTTRPSW
jgi:hypothetical protein